MEGAFVRRMIAFDSHETLSRSIRVMGLQEFANFKDKFQELTGVLCLQCDAGHKDTGLNNGEEHYLVIYPTRKAAV